MSTTTITAIEPVGADTIALELETPPGFKAYPGQFILVRNGEESGYYTISSPNTAETFEITVGVDPEGTIGPWLASQDIGNQIQIDGPFGDISYRGNTDATVLASGPGIGPAVGIGERGIPDAEITILYLLDDPEPAADIEKRDEQEEEGSLSDPPTKPAHASRLETLEQKGANIVVTDEPDRFREALAGMMSPGTIYVFGYANFVETTKEALRATETPVADVEIENFGPA